MLIINEFIKIIDSITIIINIITIFVYTETNEYEKIFSGD